MYKIKINNYKVVLEYGNGRKTSFKVNGLTGLFLQCKKKAAEKETFMLYAKVSPISKRGKAVTKGQSLLLDTTGTFHFMLIGDRLPFGKI
jgi:hypothetical protein